MRKNATEKASSAEDGDSQPVSTVTGAKGWFKEHWRPVTLFAIILAAFLMRFVFAYGISAGSNYALSGGTSASSNLRIITEILAGTYSPANEGALNYPYGSLSIYPPLYDYLMAAVAYVVTLFGVSAGTVAAGTLAWSAPIFAALTVIPVYLAAKKMFNDDATIGLVSALLYAFFGLLIMTTVFSNGTVYAFVGLLFAVVFYELACAFANADKAGLKGFKAPFTEKSVLRPIIIAAVLLAAIFLSWNSFFVIVAFTCVGLIIAQVVTRVLEKDLATMTVIIDVPLVFGLLVSALYYIPMGLWDAVFSGPFCLGLIVVAFTLVFAFLQTKPWVLTVPIFAVVGIIFAALLYVFVPDLFTDMVHGNSLYTGSLMIALTSEMSRNSISEMAAYYGWLTLWFPLVLGVWMVYRARKSGGTMLYTYTAMSLLVLFMAAWFSSDYAFIAGIVFAVGAGALLVKIVRYVDLRTYFSSLRGNGIKAGAKKSLQFMPLVAVLVVAFLVVAPNAALAGDAATSTNDEHSDYYGGLGYTIQTSDSSIISSMWNSYDGIDKTGAIVTWFGYSNDAVYSGGFDSVTDVNGGGTAAASALLLASSSGEATAVMIVRLLLANGVDEFKSALENFGLDSDKIAGYINSPATAVAYINDNSDDFPGLTSDVDQDNAVYYVVSAYIAANLDEPEIEDLYVAVENICSDAISYVEVDGSMLPLYYGDGSYFSTLAYLGGYELDTYSAPEQFYSYNTYTGYATYTDAMYSTYLWLALIGISADEAGYSSTASFLSALALSDGSVKAVPGYGLSGVTVDYWHVMYNADSDASASSDGWEDMDASEAIALQNEQGGVINYLSSVVVLKYSSADTTAESGTVTYTDNDGNTAAAAGVKVAVFEKTSYDSSGVTNYVQTCTVFTDADGRFCVNVPTDTDYYVVYYSGATTLRDGTPIATSYNSVDTALNITATSVSGYLTVDDDVVYVADGYVVITGASSGLTYQASVTDGAFSFGNVMPDTYTAQIYSAAGDLLNTVDLTVSAGVNSGVQLDATSGTLTVTVTDQYNNSVISGTVHAVDTSSGYEFTAAVTDKGTAVLTVVPGTYSIYISDSQLSSSTTTVTVASEGSKTATLTVYDSKTVSVTGGVTGAAVTLMAPGFNTSSSTGTLYVPSVGGINATYTAYSVSGGNVYYGVGSGSSIAMTSAAAATITGTLVNLDGNATAGSVIFITADGAMFIFAAADDGTFTAVVPTGLTYTLWAYDGLDSALLETVSVSGDHNMGDVEMTGGRSVTATFNYTTRTSSSTTRGIAFCDVTAALTVGGTDYSLTMLTNSSGRAVFWVPEDVKVVCTLTAFTTSAFVVPVDQTGTADASTTNRSLTAWTLEGIADSNADNDDTECYVSMTSVKCDYAAYLTAYSDSGLTYTLGTTPKSVVPGQYTCVVKGDSGYYYSGTVYITPGMTELTLIGVTEVMTVTVAANTGDTVTVTAVENSDGDTGEYHVVDADKHIYYLVVGYDYYFTVTAGAESAETQVAYASVTADTMGTDLTLDLTDKAAEGTITGYIGTAADGTLTVTYTNSANRLVSIPFEISDGTYSAVVPVGYALTLTADVSQTVSHMVYNYTGTTLVTAAANVDGAVVNFSVLTDSNVTSEYTDINYSFVGDQHFADGRGSLTVIVTNNGVLGVTYVITAGDAWVLDQNYVLTVAGGATESIVISGYYNSYLIGADNANLTVVVSTADGTEVGSFAVPGKAFTVTPDKNAVQIDVAGGTDDAASDAVNGYAYKYAITFDNTNSYLKLATVSAQLTSADADWSVYLIDADGAWIKESGGVFNLAGYATTTVYVMLICADGEASSVPGITVTATVAAIDGSAETLETSSSALTVTDNQASGTLTAVTAAVDQTDGGASGDSVTDSAASLSTTFWVLTVLTVLVLALMFYEGSKRGVFTRKK